MGKNISLSIVDLESPFDSHSLLLILKHYALPTKIIIRALYHSVICTDLNADL